MRYLLERPEAHYTDNYAITKQEFLVISLTDFFDAASRRHNDVILMPAIRTVSGNDFVPVGQRTVHRHTAHARATVELLCQEMPNFLAPNLWRQCGLQTAQISVLWITRSGLSCSIASEIHSVDELKRRLIDVSVLNSRFVPRVSRLTRDIDIANLSVCP